jgi:hypothetical protein
MIAHILPWAGSSLLLCVAAGTLHWSVRSIQSFEIPEVPPLTPVSVTPADAEGEKGAWVPVRRPAVYYAAITDRPLFAPLRRPVPPDSGLAEAQPEAAAVPEADIADQAVVPVLALHGTMVMSGGGSALIGVDDQPPEWIAVGGVIAGFTVNSIGPDWAQLSSSKTDLKLDMYPK